MLRNGLSRVRGKRYIISWNTRDSSTGIRVKLLVGKLNQPSKTLVVIRSTIRTFGKPEWEQVAQRLQVWKDALQDVLQVVASAQKKVPATVSQTGAVAA
jgi:translation initiation factor 3 subunit M